MKPSTIFRIPYRLAAINGVANFISVFLVNRVVFREYVPPPAGLVDRLISMDAVFIPLAFLVVGLISVWLERPPQFLLQEIKAGRKPPPGFALYAKRRLLNYPFLVMGLDLLVWFIAALTYTLVYHHAGIGPPELYRPFFINVGVGFLTAVIVFFWVEHAIQMGYASRVFPDGGLKNIPGARRIGLRFRMLMMAAACNVLPLLSVVEAVYLGRTDRMNAAFVLEKLSDALVMNAWLFMVMGLAVMGFVGLNITRPFRDILRALKQIGKGRYDIRVPVRTNDEIGYTGDAINEMARGLSERDRLRASLALAEEVQQSLLPAAAPEIQGFSIAGQSLYCDETGGDFYDYIVPDGPDPPGFRAAVGDACDHGVQSALLMATARALLRQRSFAPGSTAEVVGDVNRTFCLDVGDSGRFLTLFFCSVDRETREMAWVNAGHDAAMHYSARTGEVTTLRNHDPALGLDPGHAYAGRRLPLEFGDVVAIATDGTFESRNPAGEPFGRERFAETLKSLSGLPARTLLAGLMERLAEFRADAPVDDDITIVVIAAR